MEGADGVHSAFCCRSGFSREKTLTFAKSNSRLKPPPRHRTIIKSLLPLRPGVFAMNTFVSIGSYKNYVELAIRLRLGTS